MVEQSSEQTGIRLQKFLAEREIGSRRAIEDLIRAGKITVDGEKAILGQRVLGTESIKVSGKLVTQDPPQKMLLAFHKPKGVECTLTSQVGSKTLLDFDFGGTRVFPIGRLDKNSRGLLLMTNDGAFANKLMHPRYEHEKEYEVVVDKEIVKEQLAMLGSGELVIDDKKIQPCIIKSISKNSFRILLKEGRNRQIRKMCAACGLEVVDLLRIRVESIKLGDLKSGDWREEKFI